MIITQNKSAADRLDQQRKIANIGCSACPECGAPFKGIPAMKSWVKGFFKTRYFKQDCYYCTKCGCEWESEPYEY